MLRRPDPGLLVILLVTFAFYARALGHAFSQDDAHLVQVLGNENAPNPMVATWQGVASYFEHHYWHGIYDKGDLYRPLTILGYAATWALCGDHVVSEAFPHHLLNVLLHLLATGLVFTLLGRLGVGLVARRCGTALFALLALRCEVVASVVGRAEELTFVFGMAAALLAIRREGLAPRGRVLATLGVQTALFAAFTAKESALAWVPFLLCLALARGVPAMRALAWLALDAVVPVAVYLVLRRAALAGVEAPQVVAIVNPLVELASPARVATATVIQFFALGKTLLPIGLCCEYGMATFTLRDGFLDGVVLGAALVQLALLVAGVLCLRRAPLLFLAATCFFGFAFLTGNFLFPTGVVFAERLLYTPALGLTFALVALQRSRALPVVTVALLLPSCWELVVRVPVWKDDATLFLHDAEVNPRAVRLQTSAAKILRDRGLAQIDDAIGYLKRAVEIAPGYALAWNNLGAMLLDAGRTDEAIVAFRRGFEGTLRTPGEDEFRLHANLGAAFLRKGQRDDAVPLLRRATELMPPFRPAWLDLFTALDEPTRTAQLDAELGRAERSVPGDPRVAFYRGLRALDGDRASEAVERLQASLRDEPDHWPTSFALAEALTRQGQREVARRVLDRLAATPQAPEPIRSEARKRAEALARGSK